MSADSDAGCVKRKLRRELLPRSSARATPSPEAGRLERRQRAQHRAPPCVRLWTSSLLRMLLTRALTGFLGNLKVARDFLIAQATRAPSDAPHGGMSLWPGMP